MNINNTVNSLLLICITLFFTSCTSDKDSSEVILTIDDVVEINEKIDKDNTNNNSNVSLNKDFSYSFVIKNKFDFGKGKDKSKLLISNPIILNENIIFIDNKSLISNFNLEGKLLWKKRIQQEDKNSIFSPASLSLIDNNIIAAFGNGKLVKLDLNAQVMWEINLNDIIRTKIESNGTDVILITNSNKIISINTKSSEINWSYNLDIDKPSLIEGGQIFFYQNFIYAIMPNGRIAVIDFFIGERILPSFLSRLEKKQINNFDYKIRMDSFHDTLLFLENNKFLYSYNTFTKEYILFNKTINDIEDYHFFSNAFFAINSNYILKAFNIKNANLFWKIDLSKFYNKDLKIIDIIDYKDNSLLIFFDNGNIIQIDKIDGNILNNFKIKSKNINSIYFYDNYFVVIQNDAKAIIFE